NSCTQRRTFSIRGRSQIVSSSSKNARCHGDDISPSLQAGEGAIAPPPPGPPHLSFGDKSAVVLIPARQHFLVTARHSPRQSARSRADYRIARSLPVSGPTSPAFTR